MTLYKYNVASFKEPIKATEKMLKEIFKDVLDNCFGYGNVVLVFRQAVDC